MSKCLRLSYILILSYNENKVSRSENLIFWKCSVLRGLFHNVLHKFELETFFNFWMVRVRCWHVTKEMFAPLYTLFLDVMSQCISETQTFLYQHRYRVSLHPNHETINVWTWCLHIVCCLCFVYLMCIHNLLKKMN